MEASDNAVFDFVQVLDSFRHVANDVGASSVGTKTPDLPRLSDVELVLVSENTSALLDFLSWCDLVLNAKVQHIFKQYVKLIHDWF